jgi:hypothetical protein
LEKSRMSEMCKVGNDQLPEQYFSRLTRKRAGDCSPALLK